MENRALHCRRQPPATPRRPPNAELRTREHLAAAEIESTFLWADQLFLKQLLVR
jgi:hypothetical protein